MDIKDFYTHHWWKDVYNLSKKYNIRYTGLVIEDYSGQVSGVFPRNKDITRFQYFGNMLLPDAIEYSSNATAVQVMELIGGPSVAYEQAITKMGFNNLDEADANLTGALSIGGMHGGVTVKEMAAAYAYMGNGGLYYKPYSYYYVTDSDDNVIIDNRDAIPKQAYSGETATIMNRLLHYNVENSQHTRAMYAKIQGWDIVGKTGTTNDDKDAWFCGLSPYCVLATWTGFDNPATISDTTHSAKFFATVMGEYLKNKEQKKSCSLPEFVLL
jgi:penicillin-binding protein 1A